MDIAQGDPCLHEGLDYPFGLDFAPSSLAPQRIADGVYWLRMPLPLKLDHINLWLLEEEDGWTVVDTGMNLEQSQQLWRALFDGFMQGRPVRRVICTHMHPDHIGLAGWLCRQHDCELWLARQEYLMCKNLVSYTGQEAPPTAIQFLTAAGVGEEVVAQYKARFGSFGKVISPLPDSYRRLADGDCLQINGREWRVLTSGGHSPEHASLCCESLQLLISGDQILPRITPNVGVFPSEPKTDALSEWLQGQRRLQQILDSELLVLPSHQQPFFGVKVRIEQIIQSHEEGLEKLLSWLQTPCRAVDCFSVLFKNPVSPQNSNLAVGEAIAHLNCLIARGSVSCEQDAAGVNWYRRCE